MARCRAALVRGRREATGITEVWWDSLDDLQAAMTTEAGVKAAARLLEDEAKFIDFGQSTIFLTEEHPIFDR